MQVTYKLNFISSEKVLAFNRNPQDPSITPATYTAKGASDLVIINQPSDINVDGSNADDNVLIGTGALANQTLSNYDVRAFAGNDTVNVTAGGVELSSLLFDVPLIGGVIADSDFNGNQGNDTLNLATGVFDNSLFLGGQGNDTISASVVTGGEVNGNKGNDTVNFIGNNSFGITLVAAKNGCQNQQREKLLF